MAQKSILTEEEARFLGLLVRKHVDFMVIGLAAAALQGAPVVTQDIDLWFKDLQDPKIREALREVGGTYVPPIEMNPPMFAGKSVNLFDIVLQVHGLERFDKEKKNTISINVYGTKIPVLKLERILKSKKAANRKKDRLTIPVLTDALTFLKARKAQNEE